jgi:FtsP/CotA-like multicopper oxidase with cupredoxin domain
MTTASTASLSRRQLLLSGAGLALAALVTRPGSGAPAIRDYRLTARPRRIQLVGETYGETDVWSFDGTVPGPEIRLHQGERLR